MNHLVVPNIVGSAPPTFFTNNNININNNTIPSHTTATPTNTDFLIQTSEDNTSSGTSIENAICLDSDQSDDDRVFFESTSPLSTGNHNCQSEPESNDGFETEGQDVSELEEDSILTTQTHISESPRRSRTIEPQQPKQPIRIFKNKKMRKVLEKRKQNPTRCGLETPFIQMVPENTSLSDLRKMWEKSVNSGQGTIIIFGMNQVPSIILQTEQQTNIEQAEKRTETRNTEQATPFTQVGNQEKKEPHGMRDPPKLRKGHDIILWLEDAEGRRFVDLASLRRYTSVCTGRLIKPERYGFHYTTEETFKFRKFVREEHINVPHQSYQRDIRFISFDIASKFLSTDLKPEHKLDKNKIPGLVSVERK